MRYCGICEHITDNKEYCDVCLERRKRMMREIKIRLTQKGIVENWIKAYE